MKDTIKKILQFNEDRNWDQFHSACNLAKSIVIESGELLECFQWNDDFDKEHVCDELADVINYCVLLANKLGVDINDILLSKLTKNSQKYPVDKSKGTSKKYTEL